ncbi:hypothetical protein [Kitasatospora sp. NPDC088346]|uniref:hypothetical protein n=1 Tax=Kitasatospora sp. NPDC088346 TaxID=3364073 RepID=UPI0038176F6B
MSNILAGKKPARPEIIKGLHILGAAPQPYAEADYRATIALLYEHLELSNPEQRRTYLLQDRVHQLQGELDDARGTVEHLQETLAAEREHHHLTLTRLESLRADLVRTSADRERLEALAIERDQAAERVTELEESLASARRAAAQYQQDVAEAGLAAQRAALPHPPTPTLALAPAPATTVTFNPNRIVNQNFELYASGKTEESLTLITHEGIHRTPPPSPGPLQHAAPAQP